MCMFLCVMGIALFAIPVGTVFEAFQDVLQEVKFQVMTTVAVDSAVVFTSWRLPVPVESSRCCSLVLYTMDIPCLR